MFAAAAAARSSQSVPRRWPQNFRLFRWFFKESPELTMQQTTKSYATEAVVDLNDAYKCVRLEKLPPETLSINRELVQKMYKEMATIRRLETVANAMYKEKIVRGFCHLYTGQEAVCVGINSAMRPTDHLITAYRCHGWCHVMGIPPYEILGELAGRESGCQRGKGGSMHMYCKRFYGGNGIVGAQVPLGVGVGLALKNEAKGNVCVALYGDGAANQGQIFEAYNIACLWRLPVIFVCENNEYGMGTKMNRSSCSIEYYTRGVPLPGLYVDGMNVFAMRNAAQFAIDFVQENGPIIIEAHTYRYFGHSMSDPGTSYRSRDEVTEKRTKHDPILYLKQVAIAKGLITEDECKKVDDEVKKEIQANAEKVKKDKEIKPEELWADVYMECKEDGIRDTIGIRHKHFRVGKTMEKDNIKLKSFKPDEKIEPKGIPTEILEGEAQMEAIKETQAVPKAKSKEDSTEKSKPYKK
ncbi:pyruvate dehydrogenase E1 component subunit alpha, mitochondrial-like [Rhagoletis pomonella]|uniref:pyruvate dehydrogenase E1 component subunit alpha, mitochondrial-like n=1 Tax=Rhagoletis pomonella TaxID=28610 RepID=UPI00177E2418|nr:pyruvate dehydrogenase E1 component subunit alpha, mitochondrial-like [Rhagoletis pomonella]